MTVYAGVVDPGEGNDSMLTQLAADGLNLPEKVRPKPGALILPRLPVLQPAAV